MKIKLTKKYLEKCLKEELTTREIAKVSGHSYSNVCYFIRKHNIPIKHGKIILDLVGYKFNKLTVIKLSHLKSKGINKGNIYVWQCLCDCGNIVNVYGSKLKSGHTKSCGCIIIEKLNNYHKNKHYENLSGKYFSSIKHRAKQKKLEFNLTLEYLWELYLKQNKKCGLTGLDIDFGTKQFKEKQISTASLDRINSKEGYVRDNVQWVHTNINKMKFDFDEKYFIEMCTMVYKNHEKKIVNV